MVDIQTNRSLYGQTRKCKNSITSLHIHDIKISPKNDLFLKLSTLYSKLQTLHLSNITGLTCTKLEKFVACLNVTSFGPLKHLKIERCDQKISSNLTFQAQGRMLSEGYLLLLERFRLTLESFELSSNGFIWEKFPKCPKLKVLYLHNNQSAAIQLDHLVLLIIQFPRLEATEFAIAKLNGTFDRLTAVFKSGVKALSIQNYVGVELEKMICRVEQGGNVRLPFINIINNETKSTAIRL
jgi:hypothetical protein